LLYPDSRLAGSACGFAIRLITSISLAAQQYLLNAERLAWPPVFIISCGLAKAIFHEMAPALIASAIVFSGFVTHETTDCF